MTATPSYDAEKADQVLERIADGQSLREVCRAEGMPGRETFNRWLRNDEGLQARYVQACRDRSDAMLEEILDISNDETRDWQHRRLQIATRQWAMSKMNPKRYGEKMTHAGDPDAPLVPPGPDDLARRLAFLFTKADHAIREQQAEQEGERKPAS